MFIYCSLLSLGRLACGWDGCFQLLIWFPSSQQTHCVLLMEAQCWVQSIRSSADAELHSSGLQPG